MRRARPYRGETLDPARIIDESLTPDPELENSQGQLPFIENSEPNFRKG